MILILIVSPLRDLCDLHTIELVEIRGMFCLFVYYLGVCGCVAGLCDGVTGVILFVFSGGGGSYERGVQW